VNAKLKSKLASLKKNAPAILGAIGTVVATAAAVYYKSQRPDFYFDEDYEPIWVRKETMNNVMEKGRVLKYRAIRIGPKDKYVQITDAPEFSENFNESWAEAEEKRWKA
jgi:hypothetical protein